MANLTNRKVAILTEAGFEEVELSSPMQELKKAGAAVHLISPQEKTVRAMKDHNWGADYPVDKHLSEANPGDYDALVLPGGVINPDQLRMNDDAIHFIKAFITAGKPIGAICHGPQSLITAGVVEGRTLTSYPSIKIDLINAGANWVDKEVVVDNGLVTSRNPNDLPAFNAKLIEEIAEGVHAH